MQEYLVHLILRSACFLDYFEHSQSESIDEIVKENERRQKYGLVEIFVDELVALEFPYFVRLFLDFIVRISK